MPRLVAEATLGGIPLSCRRGQSHSWVITSGSQPYVGEFLVSKPRAEAIMDRGAAQLAGSGAAKQAPGRKGQAPGSQGPLTLRIAPPGRNPLVVKGLYATALKAGDDLNTWTVQVSDRRWLWSRKFVERSYNLTRSSGETRWNGEKLVPLQAADVVPDLTHRRASLRGGQALWTPVQILEDVLGELCGSGGFVIEPSARGADGIPVQDLELHDAGPQALDRVLAHLPGVTVCPGYDGKIRAFSTLDQSEVSAAKSAGRPIAGSGLWRVVDRSLVRPETFRVFFQREQEIRFDTGVSSYPRGKQPPLIENVIQVTDPTLTLADGRQVASGSWITFDEFFAALALGTNVSANGAGANHPGLPTVNDDLIRKFALCGIQYISRNYTHHLGAFDQLWAGRFQAIGTHWRRTYRIGSQWFDRMRSFKARRAVVTDRENAKRAPSPVYVNHLLKPHMRSLSPKGTDARGFKVTDSYATNLARGRPAPVTVNVLDEGAGILQFAPRSDLFGLYEEIQLGRLETGFPVARASQLAALWVGLPGGSGGKGPAGLAGSFRLSTILSVVPASPNNEGRLHVEDVDVKDAADVLGVAKPSQNRGPVYEATTGLETARFAWLDAKRKAIHESIFSGQEAPRELLVNPQRVLDVATAQAARILSMLMDRAEGEFSVTLNPSVKPTGNLRAVSHTFSLDGQGKTTYTTRLSMPPAVADVSVEARLSESTRQVLLRLVQE